MKCLTGSSVIGVYDERILSDRSALQVETSTVTDAYQVESGRPECLDRDRPEIGRLADRAVGPKNPW